MKKLLEYNDYMLDLLIESIKSNESPVIFSGRFLNIVERINHPIAIEIDRISNKRNHIMGKETYIDLDDSGIDKVSFITSSKAIELLSKDLNRDELDYYDYSDTEIGHKLLNKTVYQNRSVTTIGRLIKKLFLDKYPVSGKPTEDIESFVEMFKSKRDLSDLELVKGDDIVKYYHEENYLSGHGTLNGSCMKYGDCSDYIRFYANSPEKVSLLILKDKEFDLIKGRALVWNLSEPIDRIFMDRIYTVNSYDVELFKTYASMKGWLYKSEQSYNNRVNIIDPKNSTSEKLDLVVNDIYPMNGQYFYFPYMDTLCYYDPDYNLLTNNTDRLIGEKYYVLHDTEGGYEEESRGTYVEHYGRVIPDYELVYCGLGDEYRTEEDAYYIPYYNKYATKEFRDNDMVECDYYSNLDDKYRLPEDTVNIYDTDKVACEKWASRNLIFSNYYNAYLPENTEVFSQKHDTYIYGPESVEVYLNSAKTETDRRVEDDGSYFEYEGDYYDEDVTEEDLKNR